MEVEQRIWVYVQGNLSEQQQEPDAYCLHDHGDGDDGYNDHDVAWAMDVHQNCPYYAKNA